MRTLEDFANLPDAGEVSLCEINGRAQTAPSHLADVSTFTKSTISHPKIHIIRDHLHHSGIFNDEGRALFLPTDVPFLKQLTQIYMDQGLIDTFHAAQAHPHPLISKSASVCLKLHNYINSIQILLNPSLQFTNAHIINELSETRNWANSTLRCLSWQPHSSRLAVATNDDCVRIYCNETQHAPILRCKFQKNITCLAWRPKSLTEIAVGHENGIIVWNVDFANSLAARPSVSNSLILSRPNHSPIISLVWAPFGDILVSAAANDSFLHVWQVELNKTSILKGARDGNGNVLLKFSKDKLVSATNGIVFRIWDCVTWQSERWTILTGRLQAACWTECGNYLLFATSAEHFIYCLTIGGASQLFTSLSNEGNARNNENNHAMPIFDLSTIEFEGVCIGGLVQSMAIDPKGLYLAVIFKDTTILAIFNVVKANGMKLQLIPSSLVKGLMDEVPVLMGFQQNFDSDGACLSIGWSTGRVQHYPILYTDGLENQSSFY